MNRLLALALLTVLFSTIGAPRTFTYPTVSCKGGALTAQERIALRQIQERIEEGLEAQEAKDLPAFMRTVAPDFTLTLTDGSTLDRTLVERGMKQNLAWILAISDRTRVSITCLSLKGKEATIETDQHFVRTIPDRKDGSPHELITNVTHREIWVYTVKGWVVKQIQELKQGPTFLDGAPYQP